MAAFRDEKKIDAQSRQDPLAPFGIGAGGSALPAWDAEECNRVLYRELTKVGERVRSDLVRQAKAKESDAWGQFKVSPPMKMGVLSKDAAASRWAMTWKEVKGDETAELREGARGYQDPDLKDGDVDIAGSASGRPSHSQAISSGALMDALEPEYQKSLCPRGRLWP